MIQRIQSLYLLLITLLSLLFLNGSILNFVDKSESVIKITYRGIFRETGMQGLELIEKLLLLSVVIILIPALSFIAILLFKNRKIQSLLSLLVIILTSGFIIVSFFYFWFIVTEYDAEIVPGFKMILPILILIFSILAYRGIRKDDRLIKSYDRLR